MSWPASVLGVERLERSRAPFRRHVGIRMKDSEDFAALLLGEACLAGRLEPRSFKVFAPAFALDRLQAIFDRLYAVEESANFGWPQRVIFLPKQREIGERRLWRSLSFPDGPQDSLRVNKARFPRPVRRPRLLQRVILGQRLARLVEGPLRLGKRLADGAAFHRR